MSEVQYMDIAQYIEERVDNQKTWYSKKSTWNQDRYKLLRGLSVVFAVIIPFLTGLIEPENEFILKPVIGILGVLIAAMEGLLALFKFQENWIQYRTTSESLKHHKYLFLTKTGPYSRSEASNLFIQNIEALISKENSDWRGYIKEAEIGDK